MPTFKQFIAEDSAEKVVTAMAKQLLGVMSIEQVEHIPDKLKYGSKRHSHKWVDTVNGPWVLMCYKNGYNAYVVAKPPKSSGKSDLFFVPRI